MSAIRLLTVLRIAVFLFSQYAQDAAEQCTGVGTCGEEWIIDYAGVCLFICNFNGKSTLSWQNARAACENSNLQLVTVEDAALHDYLDLVLPMNRSYWIGLRQMGTTKSTGSFVWVTNHFLKSDDFQAWQHDPSSMGTGSLPAGCVVMRNGEWLAEDCQRHQDGYICRTPKAVAHLDTVTKDPEKESPDIPVELIIGGCCFIMVLVITLWIFIKTRRTLHAKKLQKNNNNTNSMPVFRHRVVPVHVQRLEIPAAKLKIEETILGRGKFGLVYKGTVMNLPGQASMVEVAVKIPNKNEPNSMDHFKRELNILAAMERHPNIVNLLAVVIKGNNILIMELCSLGPLKKYLRLHRDSMFSDPIKKFEEAPDLDDLSNNNVETDRLSTTDLINFSYQIARGMVFLSRNKVVHRDLAARNILVCEKRVVKISDFGMAIKHGILGPEDSTAAPVRWMSPESLKIGVYSSHTDVWAYGVLLWEIFSLGEIPYKDLTLKGRISEFIQQLECGLRLERPKYAPLAMYEMMLLCWSLEGERRPSFDHLRIALQKQIKEDYYCTASDSQSSKLVGSFRQNFGGLDNSHSNNQKDDDRATEDSAGNRLRIAYEINGYQILEEEAERICAGTTLSPAILWAMTSLFQQTYPNAVEGLIDTAKMYCSNFTGFKRNKSVVQVHFNHVNHFFTSSWDSSQQEVVLFDSLGLELTWQAQHQLWLCYGQDREQIRVRYARVENQGNGVDCGPFALAFACELITSRDPVDASFTSQALREWIVDSFRRKACQPLPRTNGKATSRIAPKPVHFITANDAKIFMMKWQSQKNSSKLAVSHFPVPTIDSN